jgi:hypothetical protein
MFRLSFLYQLLHLVFWLSFLRRVRHSLLCLPFVASSSEYDTLLEADSVVPLTPSFPAHPIVPCAAPLPPVLPRAAPAPPRASLSSLMSPRAAPESPAPPHAALASPAAPCAALESLVLPCAASASPAPPRADPASPTPPSFAEVASSSRFAYHVHVYQRRGWADAPAPSREEPLVYHPVVLHRDPMHIHPMVTRRAVSVLRPIDRLVLTTSSSTTLSPESSSVRSALADPNWQRSMEYEALQMNHTWDLVPCSFGVNVFTG